jgi:hypothetical protein
LRNSRIRIRILVFEVISPLNRLDMKRLFRSIYTNRLDQENLNIKPSGRGKAPKRDPIPVPCLMRKSIKATTTPEAGTISRGKFLGYVVDFYDSVGHVNAVPA